MLGAEGERTGASLSYPLWGLWMGDGNEEGLRKELPGYRKKEKTGRPQKTGLPKGRVKAPVECCPGAVAGGGVGDKVKWWEHISPLKREWEVREPLEFFLGFLQ